ncbi:MAG: hypothetical protein J6Y49_02405 [Alphaproteobacteria bacterium]|nr:hypothetical protein [Alphaproteobacteria bacterium]
MATEIDIFGEFAPAYTISNEDQRWATTAIPNVSKVLTVAGSGDQALFYKLAGAKIIDTFDKTKNARAIQDIKFVAIQKYSLREYNRLLFDLYYADDITTVPQMQRIMPFLPAQTRRIIMQPGNNHILGAGMDVSSYPENVPTEQEYAKLRATHKRAFRFVACDLYDLGAKISGQYDLINISNIFDYCYDGKDKLKILHDLAQHLNIGGHIVYLPQNNGYWYPGFYLETPTLKLDYVKTLRDKDSKMILFQRVR